MSDSPRIIIADDHDAVRGLIARLVVRQYPSVTVAAVANGADALGSYRQYGADLVITNQDMPVLNGLDLIRALRAAPPRVPILMVSSNPAIEAQALAAGADRFLLKPFSVDSMRRALLDLLTP